MTGEKLEACQSGFLSDLNRAVTLDRYSVPCERKREFEVGIVTPDDRVEGVGVEEIVQRWEFVYLYVRSIRDGEHDALAYSLS